MRSATHCPLLLACLVARWITGLDILLRAVLLLPFLATQNPGHEEEAAGQGQAFRYCLIVLVFINDVPARTCSCIVLRLDLGEQTLNAKGAGFHGCWSSRAQRLSCCEQLGRRSRPCGLRVALASASQGTRALCPGHCRYGHRPDYQESHPPSHGSSSLGPS